MGPVFLTHSVVHSWLFGA